MASRCRGLFTWSKSIDTSSATVAGDAFGNLYLQPALLRYEIEPAHLQISNVGRTLVVNGTWEIPTPKSFSGPGRWIADGWELGLILTVSDGVPFTPTWGDGFPIPPIP